MSLQNKLSFAILLTAFVPLTYWGKLEGAEFPTHFNLLTGVPDNWGGKVEMLVLMGVAAAVYVLLVLCCRYPNLMNYPARITEENKEKLYSLGVSLGQRMNWLMMLTFSLTINCSALIAIGVMERFPVYMIWISLLAILAAVIQFIVQVRRVV